MGTWRIAILFGVAVGVAACAAGRSVERVPLDYRLEGLYGHQMDVRRAPQEPPRNLQWEHERLDVFLRVGRYLEEHPDLPGPIADALAQHELVAGMTKEQVQLVWGPPDRIRHPKPWRHTQAASTQEVWYYRQPRGSAVGRRLCQFQFADGILERLLVP